MPNKKTSKRISQTVKLFPLTFEYRSSLTINQTWYFMYFSSVLCMKWTFALLFFFNSLTADIIKSNRVLHIHHSRFLICLSGFQWMEDLLSSRDKERNNPNLVIKKKSHSSKSKDIVLKNDFYKSLHCWLTCITNCTCLVIIQQFACLLHVNISWHVFSRLRAIRSTKWTMG